MGHRNCEVADFKSFLQGRFRGGFPQKPPRMRSPRRRDDPAEGGRTAGRSLDQRLADFSFELRQRARDDRLRDAERRRRASKWR